MSKTAKRTWRERAIEYATKIMDQPENRPQVQKLAGMLIGTLEAELIRIDDAQSKENAVLRAENERLQCELEALKSQEPA